MVQLQITEKIRITIFHGQDKSAAVNAVQHTRQGVTAPDEIADTVGTHCPITQDQQTLFTLKQRDESFQQGIELAWPADAQLTAHQGLHIPAVALTNAQNHPADLREISQKTLKEGMDETMRFFVILTKLCLQCRSEGKHIHGQVDGQPLGAKNGKERAELLLQHLHHVTMFDFVPGMISQMSHIIQTDRIVTHGMYPAGQKTHVFGYAIKLGPAFRSIQGKMMKRDFRPVDASAPVAPKKGPIASIRNSSMPTAACLAQKHYDYPCQ